MAPEGSTCSWRRQWYCTPVLLPGKSHERRILVGCSPWGHEESDTTERIHFHFSLSCIGEGNGNPLQCSCLENPRDGRAWWAAIYGVAQSWTRLKQLRSTSNVFIPMVQWVEIRQKKKKSFPKLSLKKSRYSCLKSCCLKRQASNFSTLLGTDLFSLVTGEAGGHYSWHSLSGLFQLRVFLEEASAEPGLQYLVAVAPGTHSLINWLFGKWGLCSQCADPRVQHRGSRQKSLFQSLSLKQVYLYTLKVAAYGSCFHSVYI